MSDQRGTAGFGDLSDGLECAVFFFRVPRESIIIGEVLSVSMARVLLGSGLRVIYNIGMELEIDETEDA